MNINNKLQKLTYILISIYIIIYFLVTWKQFLYPLALGVLLSYLIYPITNFFEKKGFGKTISIILSLALVISIITVIIMFLIKRISFFIQDLPYFQKKIIENLNHIEEVLQKKFGFSQSLTDSLLNIRFLNLQNQFKQMFTATTETIFAILMQPVFVFIFLYYRKKFAIFFLKISGENNRPIIKNILNEISTVVTRYMLGITTVVLILFIIHSISFTTFKLQYPILIGAFMAVFSFIPYFGTLIGGTIPILFSVLIGNELTFTLKIFLYVYFINFFENNILSPIIVGNNIRISPFFIIIGLIFGAFLWGIPGMLVIIPFLAILKTIFKHIPVLQPYAYILDKKDSLNLLTFLKKILKFFKNK